MRKNEGEYMKTEEQKVQDLCSKSEIYKKVYADILAMPKWKKEVYNRDFAIATHSIKIPIDKD